MDRFGIHCEANNLPQSSSDPNLFSSGKSYILELPDEILDQIINLCLAVEVDIYDGSSFACGCDDFSFHSQSYQRFGMLCRRFHGLVLPYVYRQMGMLDTRIGGRPSAQIRHINENPRLTTYIRSLSLNISLKKHDMSIEPAALSNVRCLRLYGWESKGRAWILDALRMMSRVEHIHISKSIFKLILPLLDQDTFPSLKFLGIGNAWDDDCYFNTQWMASTVIPSSVPIFMIQSNTSSQIQWPETGQFTSLYLRREVHAESPTIFSQLIRWPKCLRHFELLGPLYRGNEMNSSTLSLHQLLQMLSVHRFTIRTIDITSGIGQPFGSDWYVDLSAFSRLEYVAISRGDMLRWLYYDPADYDRFLRPTIQVFKWNFKPLGMRCGGSWKDFGELEQIFLCELADTAKRNDTALKTVIVAFEPQTDEGLRPLEDYQEYPWDRLDTAYHYLRDLGITLRYPEPPISRRQWFYTIGGDITPPAVLANRDIRDYFIPIPTQGDQSSSENLRT